ncbi:caspase family protein [Embleya sp. NPDC059259]|uniref:caspase family protein n=1 Tax=unclassified Embleya TaxID=2699296 RepID=UPI00367F10BA
MSIPDPRTGRAVLIGVDTYTDLESLPSVAAGVRRLAELLCDPRVWGLPHDRITVLGSAATATDVRNAIVNAGRDCTGTLVLYFAGHGLRSRDGVQLHLALRDADDGHPDIGNLTYRSVRDVLNHAAHRTSSRIVLLDCCYSGLAGAMGPGTLTRTDLRHSLSEDEDGDAVVVSGGRGGCGGAVGR